MCGLTSVYRSEDDGATWVNTTHIMNSFWSSLFYHRDAVWLLGCSQEYGSIVIRRSTDGGRSWTTPLDSRSGVLFKGGSCRENPNYHCAPTPVTFFDGRIYKAFEDCENTMWPSGFKSFVISAADNSDLLDATSWTMSNKIRFNPDWVEGEYENSDFGWLEGNVVVTHEGKLCNILRLHSPLKKWNGHEASDKDNAFNYVRFRECMERNKAAMVNVEGNGSLQDFDPANGFIDFPGGGISKFTIRYDIESGLYLSMVNSNFDSKTPSLRNVLSLVASKNLFRWHLVKKLLEDDSGLDWEKSCELTGFQYVDWQFDRNNIIYVTRTAHRGAHCFHDSNRITFHKLKAFRNLLQNIASN